MERISTSVLHIMINAARATRSVHLQNPRMIRREIKCFFKKLNRIKKKPFSSPFFFRKVCFSTLFWRKSRLSEISSVRGQLWIFPHWLIAETSARPFYVQLTETVRWPRLGHRSFVCFIKGQNISADTCLMHISAYWATMSQIFTLISSNTNQNYNLIMRGMRGWWEVSENCA